MEILVFKTNLKNKKNIKAVMQQLNALPHIQKWNVDLHDKDRILRVVAAEVESRAIEIALQKAGYYCEAL